MVRYSIEWRTKKYVRKCEFLSFAGQLSKKYRKQLLNAELDGLKTTSKKVVHKTAKTTGEFIGNKVTNKIMKKSL